jgi:DNA-binding response OmpR family regulator
MPNNTTASKKILLIEDDEFISRAYAAGLTKAGYEVHTASDGNEGLEKIRNEKHDLVLLDLIMPMKDGFETLQEIQNDDSLNHIPILVVSNLGQESDIQKARELGAKDFLIKSNYSMKQVIEKIKEYIE